MNGHETFLAYCDDLVEPVFQETIVRPFLEALGATHIEHTHGRNERGKDYLYIMPTAYNLYEMHVCVVKNGAFNARSGHANSIQMLLQQIDTAKRVTALNKMTNQKEEVKKICVVSNRSIPDTVTGDFADTLKAISNYTVFIMGDTFAKQFEELCPEKYREILYPGSAIINKIFEQASTHTEALVFKLPHGVVTRFYVDMRMLTGGLLTEYINKNLRPRTVDTDFVSKALINYFEHYMHSVRGVIDIPNIFLPVSVSEGKSASRKNADGSLDIRVKYIYLDQFYDFLL